MIKKYSNKTLRIIISGILCLLIAYVACSCTQKEPEEEIYTITQYGDYEDRQHMFYTIEDSKKNLIIIDGGWDSEADTVREVISQYNNHVSAWIITHPHPDHAGAFNVIAAEPGDIVIDEIYTVDVNYERYKETAHYWDAIEVYEVFSSLIPEMDNVYLVHEGDYFSCLGLDFNVIHAWDDFVDTFNNNLCNKGSMCFVVSGEENSMLFMADTESPVEDEILNRHKDELDVDYIQLGHHGNWGPTTKFYDNTNPRAVFFDSTRFIFESEGYDASELKAYFENRGIDIYTFETQPNQVELK